MLFNICFFGILFILFLLIFNFINRHKIKNKKNLLEMNYLASRFNLNKRKIDYKKLIKIFNVTNAFIIAFVCTVISVLPLKYIWQLLIGFVLLFIMMYLCYELVGNYCVKKGWTKNGTKSQKNRK